MKEDVGIIALGGGVNPKLQLVEIGRRDVKTGPSAFGPGPEFVSGPISLFTVGEIGEEPLQAPATSTAATSVKTTRNLDLLFIDCLLL
jgi:hypothetical protein